MNKETFHLRLTRLLEATSCTNERLARRFGVGRGTVRRWRTGMSKPTAPLDEVVLQWLQERQELEKIRLANQSDGFEQVAHEVQSWSEPKQDEDDTIIEAATKAPWHIEDQQSVWSDVDELAVAYDVLKPANAEFITRSREGWPRDRAILRKLLRGIREAQQHFNQCVDGSRDLGQQGAYCCAAEWMQKLLDGAST